MYHLFTLLPEERWPVDPTRLVAFILAALIVELTPGPNMGYLAIVAASRGVRAGMAMVAGVTLGLTSYMLASVFGLTELIAHHRPVYQSLRWLGVAYLVWLAIDAWRAAGMVSVKGAPDPFAGLLRLFLRGLLTNLLNVKAAIFYIALLPTFIDPEHGSAFAQAVLLGATHLTIALAIHCSIVGGAARLSRDSHFRMLGQRRVGRWFATGIGLTAIWMVWETRT